MRPRKSPFEKIAETSPPIPRRVPLTSPNIFTMMVRQSIDAMTRYGIMIGAFVYPILFLLVGVLEPSNNVSGYGNKSGLGFAAFIVGIIGAILVGVLGAIFGLIVGIRTGQITLKQHHPLEDPLKHLASIRNASLLVIGGIMAIAIVIAGIISPYAAGVVIPLAVCLIIATIKTTKRTSAWYYEAVKEPVEM